MPIPAIAAATAAQKGAATVGKIFDYPVIGIRRKVIRHTKTRTSETDYSLQLRGWELALGGAAAALVWYALNGGFGNGTKDLSKLNPLDPFGITGPVGAAAWAMSPGGALQALINGTQKAKAQAPFKGDIKKDGSPWYPIPGLIPGKGGGWTLPP